MFCSKIYLLYFIQEGPESFKTIKLTQDQQSQNEGMSKGSCWKGHVDALVTLTLIKQRESSGRQAKGRNRRSVSGPTPRVWLLTEATVCHFLPVKILDLSLLSPWHHPDPLEVIYHSLSSSSLIHLSDSAQDPRRPKHPCQTSPYWHELPTTGKGC